MVIKVLNRTYPHLRPRDLARRPAMQMQAPLVADKKVMLTATHLDRGMQAAPTLQAACAQLLYTATSMLAPHRLCWQNVERHVYTFQSRLASPVAVCDVSQSRAIED